MKNFRLLVSLNALFPCIALAAEKIAIFDFDDRTGEKLPQSKFIEQKIHEKVDAGIEITQFSAMGNEQKAISILSEIDQKKFNLAIVITSDAMKVAYHTLKNTQYLFTNVNNPAFLGLKDLNKPGEKRSGVSYYVPIEKQFQFFKKIAPSVKKFGFIFDDAAASRAIELREARALCEKEKLGFEAKLVKKKEDIEAAAKSLVDAGIDAVVLTSSKLVYENAPIVTGITNAKKVPVFSFHKNGVKGGAVAALAGDYSVLNENLLIPMVKKVLKDKVDPGTLPVAFVATPIVSLNLTNAQKIGLKIPDSVVQEATEKL